MMKLSEIRTFGYFEHAKQEIKDVFRKFDINEDGFLHPHEFRVAVEAMGFNLDNPNVSEIMLHVDNEANAVTLRQFEEIIIQLKTQQDSKDEVISLFKIFDCDNTGKISLQNLEQISLSIGENISQEELCIMIEEFDKDGDGKINIDEFLQIFMEDEENKS